LLLWRYALRYAVAACKRACCGKGGGGLRASEIHQDFYQQCSFATLVAMWKVTNEASERMAERALFDEASGFVGQADIDLYLTKSLYPRGAALEKRFRALALDVMESLNKLQADGGRAAFTEEQVRDVDVQLLINLLLLLDHRDELNFRVPIKDELQSYNVLRCDKYKRFKRLKEVLDARKRLSELNRNRV